MVYQFANHGKTPAVVKLISASLIHLSELPETISYIDKIELDEFVIRGGEIYPTPLRRMSRIDDRAFPFAEDRMVYFRSEEPMEAPLNHNAIVNLQAGNSFLWFYGHIVYDDVFGLEHETAFCWRYNGVANSLTRTAAKNT